MDQKNLGDRWAVQLLWRSQNILSKCRPTQLFCFAFSIFFCPKFFFRATRISKFRGSEGTVGFWFSDLSRPQTKNFVVSFAHFWLFKPNIFEIVCSAESYPFVELLLIFKDFLHQRTSWGIFRKRPRIWNVFFKEEFAEGFVSWRVFIPSASGQRSGSSF